MIKIIYYHSIIINQNYKGKKKPFINETQKHRNQLKTNKNQQII